MLGGPTPGVFVSDANGYHLSLALTKDLFSSFLGAALPFEVKRGRFHLLDNVRAVAGQLQVKEKVKGLLTDSGGEGTALATVGDRASTLWHEHRDRVYQTVNDIVQIEGEWEVLLDRKGSDIAIGDQMVGLEATVTVHAEGTAKLLRENVEVPFNLGKSVGASIELGKIRYDKAQRKILGNLQNLGVNLGENVILKMLNDLAVQLLDQQLEQYREVPILQKDQVDGMLGGLKDSPLKMQMDVDDMALVVNEQEISLKVRFGFTQLQLETS